MQAGMLVLILKPTDILVPHRREDDPRKPNFGIVRKALDSSGRYLEFGCSVATGLDTVETLPVGMLVPLLMLPEEDVRLDPREAFAKWAAEIVWRQAIVHLSDAQREFLGTKIVGPR